MLVNRFIATYREKYKDDFHTLYKVSKIVSVNSLGEQVVQESVDTAFQARILVNSIADSNTSGFEQKSITFLYIGTDILFHTTDTILFKSSYYNINNIQEKFAIQGTTVLYEIKAVQDIL